MVQLLVVCLLASVLIPATFIQAGRESRAAVAGPSTESAMQLEIYQGAQQPSQVGPNTLSTPICEQGQLSTASLTPSEKTRVENTQERKRRSNQSRREISIAYRARLRANGRWDEHCARQRVYDAASRERRKKALGVEKFREKNRERNYRWKIKNPADFSVRKADQMARDLERQFQLRVERHNRVWGHEGDLAVHENQRARIASELRAMSNDKAASNLRQNPRPRKKTDKAGSNESTTCKALWEKDNPAEPLTLDTLMNAAALSQARRALEFAQGAGITIKTSHGQSKSPQRPILPDLNSMPPSSPTKDSSLNLDEFPPPASTNSVLCDGTTKDRALDAASSDEPQSPTRNDLVYGSPGWPQIGVPEWRATRLRTLQAWISLPGMSRRPAEIADGNAAASHELAGSRSRT